MIDKFNEVASHISGGDALRLLELIRDSLSCESEKDFKQLFAKIGELFPFDFAGAEMGYYDKRRGAVVIDGINISFPEEWVNEYFSKNYHQMSVLTKENFKTYQPQYIVNTWKKRHQKKEIISLCLDHEIRGGYAHGASPSAPGKKGSMFVFASSNMTYDARTVSIIENVVPHLHEAYSRMADMEQSRKNKAVLSGREREILNWLTQGKSSWDTSVILGISQSTVNFHITNIMRKLGACNRAQAIAIAIHMGIVSPA
jgi:LuxR family transcriptional regulator, quorum-sensing system regulator CviR